MDNVRLLGCFGGTMYYVGKNGQQTGPFTLDQVKAKYASGEILPTDLVWKEGTADWKPASAFAELAEASAAPGAPPTSYQAPSPSLPGPSLSKAGGGLPPAPYGNPNMQPPGGGAQVPNYLVWAILSTICCCVPFGIPAIVFASQVNSKLAVGDVAGAIQASEKAKMWCWIAFGLGLLAGILGFIAQILAAQQGSQF